MRPPRRLDLPDSGAPQRGDKRHAPSAARNLEPIAAVLAMHLPASGSVLEIASGTGEHACAFAARFPSLHWQPSDIDPACRASIRAHAAEAELPNLSDPVALDAAHPGWAGRLGRWEAILLVNLLHLIAEEETTTLLSEAARALVPGGRLFIYGPFRRAGELVTEGDRAFDASLRAQDPRIGYKEVETVRQRLRDAGLSEVECIDMPAGNLTLVHRASS